MSGPSKQTNQDDSRDSSSLGDAGSLSDLLAQKRRISPELQNENVPPERRVRPPVVSQDAKQMPVGCWLIPLVAALLLSASWGLFGDDGYSIQSSFEHYEPIFNDGLATNFEKGFELDFSNNEWSSRIDQDNKRGELDWIYTYWATGETANHLPGVSWLKALGRMGFLDSAFLLETVPLILFVIGLTILINAVQIQFGWLAFIIGLGLMLIELSFVLQHLMPGDMLIASLVTISFATFVTGLGSLGKSKRTILPWPIAGACLGATTLFIFQASLWLMLLLGVWTCVSLFNLIRNRSIGMPTEAFVLFWIGAMVVATPWWIRNCRVTERFKPFGFVVQTNLGSAYSDEAISNRGNLDLESTLKRRDSAFLLLEFSDTSLLKRESAFAKEMSGSAFDWMEKNPAKIPELMAWRVATHIGCTPLLKGSAINWQQIFRFGLVCGALIGCLLSWRQWGGVIFCLLMISAIVVGLTWSDHGRLLVPFHAVLDVAFAIGIAKLFSLVRRNDSAAHTNRGAK